jgi:hypothetical protein
MRYFFSLLALVATATLSAQSLRINEVDDFTGDSKKATTFEQVGYNVTKLKFSFISINETRALFAYVTGGDLGCCGTSDSYIFFKFTDGTTMKVEDSGDIDCDETCQSLYIFNDIQWLSLTSKSVEKIRVGHSDLYDDIDKGIDAGKIRALAKMVD